MQSVATATATFFVDNTKSGGYLIMTHRHAPVSKLTLLLLFLVLSGAPQSAFGQGSPTLEGHVANLNDGLEIVAAIAPSVKLAVDKTPVGSLLITEPYYHPKTATLEFNIFNSGNKRAAAWAIETALNWPGMGEPFTLTRTKDYFSNEEKWLRPGDGVVARVPVDVADRSAEDRDIKATVRIGAVVYEDLTTAGDPGRVTRLLGRREALYRNLYGWGLLIDEEISKTSSVEDAFAALNRLEALSFEEDTAKNAAKTVADPQVAAMILSALNRSKDRPDEARLALQELGASITAWRAMVRKHLPVPFRCVTCSPRSSSVPRRPSQTFTKEGGCQWFASKTASGNQCTSSGKTESWSFSCDGIDLTGQTGTAASLYTVPPPYNIPCCGDFGGDGPFNGEIFEDVLFMRTVHDGIENRLGNTLCALDQNDTIEADCPCMASIEDVPCGCSPILISGSDGRFQLTSRTDGVHFDLDNDGTPEATAWTAEAADDAFLVLDRNLNGVIDNGTELFGDGAPQPPSDEPNGYLALAVWDDPPNGGNGDGLIDAGDEIYDALRMWTDRNHNGESEASELESLADFGIVALALDYVRTERKDRYGNSFRFKSKARTDQGGVKVTCDVFFTSQE